MTIIPFFAIENKKNFVIQEKKEKKFSLCSKEDMYGYVAKEFRGEYNFETLKAITIILQSNYSFKEINPTKNKKTYLNKNDFCKKFKEKGDKYYDKIEKAVNEVYGEIVFFNNKKLHIPYCYVLSEDNDNSNYGYLKNCGTPWDCVNKSYKESKEKFGISLNSLNKLCENGLNYQEALGYFLNDIEIKLPE